MQKGSRHRPSAAETNRGGQSNLLFDQLIHDAEILHRSANPEIPHQGLTTNSKIHRHTAGSLSVDLFVKVFCCKSKGEAVVQPSREGQAEQKIVGRHGAQRLR